MTENAIEIREFRQGDLETVVEFSLRAWAPVFASVRGGVLGDDIVLASIQTGVRARKTPSDRAVQMMNVTFSRKSPVGAQSVSWPSRLSAFHERIGVIDIIGVDPDYQRRGISSRLTEFATQHVRSRRGRPRQ